MSLWGFEVWLAAVLARLESVWRAFVEARRAALRAPGVLLDGLREFWGSLGALLGLSQDFEFVSGRLQGRLGRPMRALGSSVGALGGAWEGPRRAKESQERLLGSWGASWRSLGCSGGPLGISFGGFWGPWGALASFQMRLGSASPVFSKMSKNLRFSNVFYGRHALEAFPGVPGGALGRLWGAQGAPGRPMARKPRKTYGF